MKDIVALNFYLPTNEDDFISLKSNESLSDADLVICSLNWDNTKFSYGHDSSYRGKTSYNLNISSKILESSKHWNRELDTYLKSGRNLYLFLSEKKEFWIDSGRRETSGTGRNQKVTNIVQPFSNYEFLPFHLDIHNAKGKKMNLRNDLLKPFFKSFEKDLTFEAYLDTKEEEEITTLITTRNNDKILAVKLDKYDGKIIILPFLDLDDEKYYEADLSWNKEGLKQGKKLIYSIIEIENSLTSKDTRTPKPDWLNNKIYNLNAAEEVKEIISKNQEEIQKLSNKNEQLKEVLVAKNSIKDLLFESGKPLELAVTKCLELMGYKAENFDDGVLELDQVINSPEKQRYIGECEGKENKPIDISKFRQLQDSLNEDFEREDVEEKAFGILFGNPFRMEPLDKRTKFFTPKCENGAKREKIALVKTIDLFFIAKYLSENKNEKFKKECRKSIHKGLGKIVTFPDIPSK
ncbi:hypothetical protein ACNI3T_00505 [Christiangramia sp. ASW11-125]|uniref:hypothetical protein n=1 Tax=Christiangramia sp. ASW11-125 TaxID=3400701 RepID=UPI003AAFADB2